MRLPSQVHHFDTLKDKETKYHKRLALIKDLKEKAAAKAAAQGKPTVALQAALGILQHLARCTLSDPPRTASTHRPS